MNPLAWLVAGLAGGFVSAWILFWATGVHACSFTDDAGPLWIRLWRRHQQRVRCLVGHCNNAILAGDHARVLRLARRALRLDPGDAEALLHMGQAHRGLGDLDAAVTWLQRCLAHLQDGLVESSRSMKMADVEQEARYVLATVHALLSRRGSELDREQHLESCLANLALLFEQNDDFMEDAWRDARLAHIHILVEGLIDRFLGREAWLQP